MAVEAVSRERIRLAAIEELRTKGTIGLRLADVAHRAGVSQTLIHKHYRDRDGLLADVLGELIRSMFAEALVRVRHYIEDHPRNVNLIDLVDLFADADDPTYRENRWMRIRIFAAASEIPALWASLESSQEDYINAIELIAHEVRGRDGLDTPFNARPFAIGMASLLLGLIFNDMTGNKMSNIEYKRLIATYLASYHF